MDYTFYKGSPLLLPGLSLSFSSSTCTMWALVSVEEQSILWLARCTRGGWSFGTEMDGKYVRWRLGNNLKVTYPTLKNWGVVQLRTPWIRNAYEQKQKMYVMETAGRTWYSGIPGQDGVHTHCFFVLAGVLTLLSEKLSRCEIKQQKDIQLRSVQYVSSLNCPFVGSWMHTREEAWIIKRLWERGKRAHMYGRKVSSARSSSKLTGLRDGR